VIWTKQSVVIIVLPKAKLPSGDTIRLKKAKLPSLNIRLRLKAEWLLNVIAYRIKGKLRTLVTQLGASWRIAVGNQKTRYYHLERISSASWRLSTIVAMEDLNELMSKITQDGNVEVYDISNPFKKMFPSERLSNG